MDVITISILQTQRIQQVSAELNVSALLKLKSLEIPGV